MLLIQPADALVSGRQGRGQVLKTRVVRAAGRRPFRSQQRELHGAEGCISSRAALSIEIAATTDRRHRSSAAAVAASSSSISPDRQLPRGQEGHGCKRSKENAQSERRPALLLRSSRRELMARGHVFFFMFEFLSLAPPREFFVPLLSLSRSAWSLPSPPRLETDPRPSPARELRNL